MTAVNKCLQGGYVVGAKWDIPETPCEFYGQGSLEIGCSKLRCHKCSEMVRNINNVEPTAETNPEELYDIKELAKAEGVLGKSETGRLYFCRCTFWVEESSRPMVVADPEPNDIAFPWRCVGHPLVTLPFVFDGIKITEKTDFYSVLKEALDARKEKFTRYSTMNWMRCAHAILSGTSSSALLAKSIARLLEDKDPLFRGRAINFFRYSPGAADDGLIMKVAREKRTLFSKEQNPLMPNCTLNECFREMLAMRAQVLNDDREPKFVDVLLLMRNEVHQGGDLTSIIEVLSVFDQDWFKENLNVIAKHSPNRWGQILDGVRRGNYGLFLKVAERIISVGLASKADILEWAEAKLTPFDRATLSKRIS
mgnify:CR=1 FL=1